MCCFDLLQGAQQQLALAFILSLVQCFFYLFGPPKPANKPKPFGLSFFMGNVLLCLGFLSFAYLPWGVYGSQIHLFSIYFRAPSSCVGWHPTVAHPTIRTVCFFSRRFRKAIAVSFSPVHVAIFFGFPFRSV